MGDSADLELISGLSVLGLSQNVQRIHGLGSKYVARTELRWLRLLPRSEFNVIAHFLLGTPWIVESVRWRWADEDLYVTSMVLVHHLTP